MYSRASFARSLLEVGAKLLIRCIFLEGHFSFEVLILTCIDVLWLGKIRSFLQAPCYA